MKEHDLALSFADDTELYDLVRPGYSSDIIQCLMKKTGVMTNESVLEIGPGSGKLTRHLIEAGLHVSCVEPATAFADFLRGKFKDYKKLDIVLFIIYLIHYF